eukprot:GILI01013075.1.p1 GENE.GILI01013075.1~~GILI01013075.1.p1  ORF type:complete len:1212 (+),score=177.77 GILI01013075.1:436-3636(+)
MVSSILPPAAIGSSSIPVFATITDALGMSIKSDVVEVHVAWDESQESVVSISQAAASLAGYSDPEEVISMVSIICSAYLSEVVGNSTFDSCTRGQRCFTYPFKTVEALTSAIQEMMPSVYMTDSRVSQLSRTLAILTARPNFLSYSAQETLAFVAQNALIQYHMMFPKNFTFDAFQDPLEQPTPTSTITDWSYVFTRGEDTVAAATVTKPRPLRSSLSSIQTAATLSLDSLKWYTTFLSNLFQAFQNSKNITLLVPETEEISPDYLSFFLPPKKSPVLVRSLLILDLIINMALPAITPDSTKLTRLISPFVEIQWHSDLVSRLFGTNGRVVYYDDSTEVRFPTNMMLPEGGLSPRILNQLQGKVVTIVSYKWKNDPFETETISQGSSAPYGRIEFIMGKAATPMVAVSVKLPSSDTVPIFGLTQPILIRLPPYTLPASVSPQRVFCAYRNLAARAWDTDPTRLSVEIPSQYLGYSTSRQGPFQRITCKTPHLTSFTVFALESRIYKLRPNVTISEPPFLTEGWNLRILLLTLTALAVFVGVGLVFDSFSALSSSVSDREERKAPISLLDIGSADFASMDEIPVKELSFMELLQERILNQHELVYFFLQRDPDLPRLFRALYSWTSIVIKMIVCGLLGLDKLSFSRRVVFTTEDLIISVISIFISNAAFVFLCIGSRNIPCPDRLMLISEKFNLLWKFIPTSVSVAVTAVLIWWCSVVTWTFSDAGNFIWMNRVYAAIVGDFFVVQVGYVIISTFTLWHIGARPFPEWGRSSLNLLFVLVANVPADHYGHKGPLNPRMRQFFDYQRRQLALQRYGNQVKAKSRRAQLRSKAGIKADDIVDIFTADPIAQMRTKNLERDDSSEDEATKKMKQKKAFIKQVRDMRLNEKDEIRKNLETEKLKELQKREEQAKKLELLRQKLEAEKLKKAQEMVDSVRKWTVPVLVGSGFISREEARKHRKAQQNQDSTIVIPAKLTFKAQPQRRGKMTPGERGWALLRAHFAQILAEKQRQRGIEALQRRLEAGTKDQAAVDLDSSEQLRKRLEESAEKRIQIIGRLRDRVVRQKSARR